MPSLSRHVVAQGLPVVGICLMLLLSWRGLLRNEAFFLLPICVLTRSALMGRELLVSSLAAACCTCTGRISMQFGPVTSIGCRMLRLTCETLSHPLGG